MSQLFQINMANGNMYATKLKDVKELFNLSNHIYVLKTGCVIYPTQSASNVVLNLYDISKNSIYIPPIYLSKYQIVEVRIIAKDSELYKKYIKQTSNLILN